MLTLRLLDSLVLEIRSNQCIPMLMRHGWTPMRIRTPPNCTHDLPPSLCSGMYYATLNHFDFHHYHPFLSMRNIGRGNLHFVWRSLWSASLIDFDESESLNQLPKMAFQCTGRIINSQFTPTIDDD